MRLEIARTNGAASPSLDESRAIVAMVGCALFGEALAGKLMLQSAALGTDPDARKRFRRDFARAMERYVFPNTAGPGAGAR
jgi:hypothetical protein